MGPRPYLCFCARKTATLEPDIQFCVGHEDLSFFTCKTACLASESLVSMSASLHLWFFMQNSDFWTRNTSLYGSQLSSGVFGCKTASFGPEQQVSMDPRYHLSFCAFKTATLGPKLHVSMGPTPHQWISACKTAYLAPELLVSMGSSPYAWFFDAIQRLLDRNNKFLCVPDITCRFAHAIQRD